MSWHLVDGIPLPDGVGGHPALDFCNTRAGWGSPQPKEYLTSWRALVLWTREARLFDGDGARRLDDVTRAAGDVELARAVRLRESLYRAATGRGTEADWGVVSDEVAAARARSVLVPAGGDVAGGGGPAVWRLRLIDARAPVDAIASAAEYLLTGAGVAGAVSACPGVGCGWLFADPRRRRRWCSMAVCGNRAKARRFAARTAERGVSPG